jgi:hypothetical protein
VFFEVHTKPIVSTGRPPGCPFADA